MRPSDVTPPRSGGTTPAAAAYAAHLTLGGAHVWFTTRGAADASQFPEKMPGGVRPAPAATGDWAGLNLGLHVGDDPQRVRRHRALVESWVGAPVRYVSQVHGADVLVVGGPDGSGAPVRAKDDDESDVAGGSVEADAIVLDARGRSGQDGPLAAAIMVADCVPLALASRDGRLAAVVHAGRAGMLGGVLAATLGRLADLDPATARAGGLLAAIGPSICGGCYEVSKEIHADVARREPSAAVTTRWGTPGVDVAAGVRAQLARLRPDVMLDDSAERCTYESADLFSHRRATHEQAHRGAPARTGRFAVVVRTAADPARATAPDPAGRSEASG